jgi:selenide,water dikinase
LRRLPQQTSDTNLLVGSNTADDAGVYRVRGNLALVQTVDFFTPVVDDAYDFGQIAAANALSDVYAMGGRPLTALNLLAVPENKVSPATIAAILRGGAVKTTEAGCALVGGHTIRNPEPIYGLAVTGVVDPRKMMTNAAARAGDVLVLTKPLGTGVATTAIKRGLASRGLIRRVTAVMKRLNTEGHELASKGWVKAATDVTGFGLVGHLGSLCKASGVGAQIDAAQVPLLSREIIPLLEQDCVPGGTKSNVAGAAETTEFEADVPTSVRTLLADAQTSGGLLLCVAPRRLKDVLDLLKRNRTPAAAVVGRIIRDPRSRIIVSA